MLVGILGSGLSRSRNRRRRHLRPGGLEHLEHRRVPAVIAGLTKANAIVTFDSARPDRILSAVPVVGLQPNESLLGIDVRPSNNTLYGLSSAGILYTVSARTGTLGNPVRLTADASDTTSPFFRLEGSKIAIDFNPVADRLRIVTDAGQNLRVNPDTGAVTTDADPFFAAGDMNVGLTPKVNAIAYTSNTAGAGVTTLLGLDANLTSPATLPDGTRTLSPSIVRQGGIAGNPSPNFGQLSTLAAFGFPGVTLRGFDFSAAGEGFAAVSFGGANANEIDSLDSVDQNLLAVNTLGTIGAGNLGVVDIAALPSVSFTTSVAAVNEVPGGSTVTLTVTRADDPNLAAGSISVDYATIAGTALPGTDYTNTTGTLTFGPGVTSQTITIPILRDRKGEPDETFTVALSNPTAGAVLGANASTTVRINAHDNTRLNGPLIQDVSFTGQSGAINGVRIQFNADLDAARAGDVVNYTLQGVLKGGRTVRIALDLAVYDPVTRTVTLDPVSPFSQTFFRSISLSVRAGAAKSPFGLTDVEGLWLDGNADGRMGGNAKFTFQTVAGASVTLAQSGKVKLTAANGGRIEGNVLVSGKIPRRAQLWLVNPTPNRTVVQAAALTNPRRIGVNISEFTGLDQSDVRPVTGLSGVTIGRKTFGKVATGLS